MLTAARKVLYKGEDFSPQDRGSNGAMRSQVDVDCPGGAPCVADRARLFAFGLHSGRDRQRWLAAMHASGFRGAAFLSVERRSAMDPTPHD